MGRPNIQMLSFLINFQGIFCNTHSKSADCCRKRVLLVAMPDLVVEPAQVEFECAWHWLSRFNYPHMTLPFVETISSLNLLIPHFTYTTAEDSYLLNSFNHVRWFSFPLSFLSFHSSKINCSKYSFSQTISKSSHLTLFVLNLIVLRPFNRNFSVKEINLLHLSFT